MSGDRGLHWGAFSAAATLFILLTSCASIGDPRYPSPQIPMPATDLVAVERGGRISVSFTIPPRTSDGLPLRTIAEIDLRVGSAAVPFASKQWLDTATPQHIEPPEEPGPVSTRLPIEGLVGRSITIAERTLSGRHRYSGWSNPVTLEVLPPVTPPVDVVPKAGPDGVELKWQGANTDTSYRIFRKAGSEKTPALVGESKTTSFTDTTSGYDVHYQYFVQALHDKAESEVSSPVSITPVDVFPPAVPSGLTASAGINAIDLTWERNTESDFRNYIIYRAANNGPLEKLAETDSPVYSDHAVKSGTTYRYAISAVDQKGNASAKSSPVEAIAP